MSIKKFLRLGLSLACLSSPMLLWMASPAGGQESNQSAATNPNATGSEVAPVFVPLPGGGTEQAFSSNDIQVAVNRAAATLNQLLATGDFAITGLPDNIVPRGGFELELVAQVLLGTNDGAALASLLESVPPAGGDTASPAPGAPPSGLIEALVNSLVGLTTDGEVDAGKLAEAVDAYNAAIKGITDAAYLRNPPAALLTIRAALSQLLAASGTSTNAQAESK
jgi:hypothetical protein